MPKHQNGGYEIDERMAQVTGKPQRIEPVREADLSSDTHQFARELRVGFGIPENGVMPEIMRTMLVHPELFRAQMAVSLALANSAIPPRDRELAVLRNAWICGAPYEWGEHVDIGKLVGVTSEEIERCTKGSEAEGWTDHERAVLRGVEELHADYVVSEATWVELAKVWDDKQLMEFPVLIGMYLGTALQQNTLRVRLAEHNPGLRHR